ncbi:MAG: tripartite tricarboxylate transporter substrate binding protein [Xanthobacteraceae bacterium]|nr:tripartite tricarboxylate transporter substrate binding protein [Xanthobacteraceae bacterium]
MITRRHLVGLAAASALAPAVSPCIARAQQAWPNRIVKLVAPFPPGGGTDVVARILSNRLSEVWAQQVIVENKPGAGGNFGAEQVARSEPDGYTILIAALPMAVNRFLFRSLSYDSISDFAPVIMICQFPNLLVVPNSSPVKSVKELIAHGKANSGKLTFASSGVGTSPHLSGELFKRMAGFEMTHVPYRGVAPALSDVIPGRVDMMFNTAAGVLQQVRAGQVRGLAVSTAKRSPTAPEFPTVAESGLPGFDVTSWYALFVPIRTPADVVKKMHADTAAILAEPAIKTRLEQVGVEVVASTPAELGARLKAETEQWGPIIKAAGIKTQD